MSEKLWPRDDKEQVYRTVTGTAIDHLILLYTWWLGKREIKAQNSVVQSAVTNFYWLSFKILNSDHTTHCQRLSCMSLQILNETPSKPRFSSQSPVFIKVSWSIMSNDLPILLHKSWIKVPVFSRMSNEEGRNEELSKCVSPALCSRLVTWSPMLPKAPFLGRYTLGICHGYQSRPWASVTLNVVFIVFANSLDCSVWFFSATAGFLYRLCRASPFCCRCASHATSLWSPDTLKDAPDSHLFPNIAVLYRISTLTHRLDLLPITNHQVSWSGDYSYVL